MKKVTQIMLLLFIVVVSQVGLAQTNTFPGTGNAGIGTTIPDALLVLNPPLSNDGNFLKMGKLISLGGPRIFNFGSSQSSGHMGYDFYDLNGVLRSNFSAKTNNTISFALRDGNSLENIKLYGTNTESWIHLPKADSKIVIGAYATYLDAEGHKFIIKDGSAKIEGNIITDSNIGIGTDSFTDGADVYRLSVDGKVRADAIKVYTTWADYVFEPNYKLPTLEEVEQYIKMHGHLKDIPSAKEVAANGIDVGETNKLLLQKIEELTLYVIELNKEIEALKKK